MFADMVARGRERRDKAKELLDAQAEALRGIVMDSSKTINDILANDTSESGGGSSKNMKDSEFKAAMDLKLKEMENTHSSELALLKNRSWSLNRLNSSTIFRYFLPMLFITRSVLNSCKTI